jgi:hypothetical protein
MTFLGRMLLETLTGFDMAVDACPECIRIGGVNDGRQRGFFDIQFRGGVGQKCRDIFGVKHFEQVLEFRHLFRLNC